MPGKRPDTKTPAPPECDLLTLLAPHSSHPSLWHLPACLCTESSSSLCPAAVTALKCFGHHRANTARAVPQLCPRQVATGLRGRFILPWYGCSSDAARWLRTLWCTRTKLGGQAAPWRCGHRERSGSGKQRSLACFFLTLQLKRGEKLMKTELWKKRQAQSSFRPDPQQLSATCQMFRCDANVRENKSVAGSRSLPGRHAAAHGSAPRRAGTKLRSGRGRFLPPGIVPPGSPSLMPATCYFCSKVLSGVNTSPLALGTFLWTGSCQGYGPAPAEGKRPRVRAVHGLRCSLAGPSRRQQGGFGKAAPQ